LSYLFEWNGCGKTAVKDDETSQSVFKSSECTSTVERFGLVLDAGESTSYAAISFVPLENTYKITANYCENGVAQFNLFNGFEKEKSEKSSIKSSAGELTSGDASNENMNKLIERIGGGEVCINPTDSGKGMEFVWNKQEIMNLSKVCS